MPSLELLPLQWPECTIAAAAEDGLQAKRALKEHHPNVMFLDIQMPGLTGLELAEHASGQCHVVFVTAYDQYAVSAFEEGAVDYIMKPLSAGRLATACQHVKAGRCTGCRDSTKWVAPMSVTRYEKGEFVAYPLIFWDPPDPLWQDRLPLFVL